MPRVATTASVASDEMTGRNQRARICAIAVSDSAAMRSRTRAAMREDIISSGSKRSCRASVRRRSRKLSLSVIAASVQVRQFFFQFASGERQMRAYCSFAEAGHLRDLGVPELLDEVQARHDPLHLRKRRDAAIDPFRQLVRNRRQVGAVATRGRRRVGDLLVPEAFAVLHYVQAEVRNDAVDPRPDGLPGFERAIFLDAFEEAPLARSSASGGI